MMATGNLLGAILRSIMKKIEVNGQRFIFAHPPALFFDLLGGWLQDSQGYPLGKAFSPATARPRVSPSSCSNPKTPKRGERGSMPPNMASDPSRG